MATITTPKLFDPTTLRITLTLTPEEAAMLAQTAAKDATIATYLRVDPTKKEA